MEERGDEGRRRGKERCGQGKRQGEREEKV